MDNAPLWATSWEWVDLPQPVAAARDRYEACLDDALGRCGYVPACFEHYSSLAEPYRSYLNAAGMGFCRERMRQAAMTYEAQHQPFPDWPFSSVEDWATADQSRRDVYNDAERAASAQTVPRKIGIPEFKFLSNGPWLVSTQEIQQALDRYEAAPQPPRAELELEALWRNWIDWLRETADHGGFTVN